MTDVLLNSFIFLLAGVVAVPIASRLGLGSVLGFLIAGIAISPTLSILHVDVVSIQHFAEFGVVMMLFLVGLELEPKMLWAMRARLIGLGGGQVGLTALAVTGPIFRFIAAAQLRELFIAAALLIVIAIALLMTLVGLSPALGTFIAGVVLANSEYRHELESDIDPFRGLLLGLFFMTVGAGINFALLFDNLLQIVGLTLGLMLLKSAVLYVLARVFKLEGSDRWLFTLGLAQAGEFGFVLLAFTVSNAVIPGVLADRLLLIVALSMLLTPALFILYDRVIAPKFSEEEEREADEIDQESKIIIAGHGRVGGLVARALRGAGLNPTVIDFSSKTLETLKAFDLKAYYGDATRPDLLHAAGVGEAELFVIAIDDKERITELAKYLHKHHPDLHVVARAVDRNHVYDLWHAGCRDIIRESYDSSMRMSRSAFEALGLSRYQAQNMVDTFNDMDRKSMLMAAEHYDPAIPALENEAYMNSIKDQRDDWEDELGTMMQAIMSGPREDPEAKPDGQGAAGGTNE